jgi:Protein of unknown function (DUF2759)
MSQWTDSTVWTPRQPPADRWTWLRWAAAVLAADLLVHIGGGVLANDWEGWGVFWGTALFVVITGVVIVGVTFGLVVRWALRATPRGNRAATVALWTGAASLVSYAVFFTWAPVLIAPAALLLAQEGLRNAGSPGERRRAMAGRVLAICTFAVFGWFVVAVFVTGTYPYPFDG